MQSRPPPGTMVYWRFRSAVPCAWRFGYCTYQKAGLIRMGLWNGDTVNGSLVEPSEIEWRAYQ